MATATKTRKAKATTFSFSNVQSHREGQVKTLISVLREGIGRKQQNQARIEGTSFDWNKFKAEFNEEISGKSFTQLLQLANRYLGLANMQAVYERKRIYDNDYRRREAYFNS